MLHCLGCGSPRRIRKLGDIVSVFITSSCIASLRFHTQPQWGRQQSQQSSKTRPNTLTKKPSVSGLHRERSSASIASQDSAHLSSASEKRHYQGADSKNKTESYYTNQIQSNCADTNAKYFRGWSRHPLRTKPLFLAAARTRSATLSIAI